MTPTHLVKRYATGIGHLDAKDGRWLATFYGRRVRQAWRDSLDEARAALRRLAGEG